ncbi:hypothetical protein Aspvir_001822 [Aspergillus viridinutans]|uniref:Uncharacterized protein n=1 Tax=Aspergillus viridinutans TaxID=75553 RepID=A0A9P3F956_ASPVI|nr:uncharacterized protein Aspvir_001822 [Aspergillus viridinutans]GIK06178.1 hypothetical protein Aspvir_001822 [Aspergillus viridinutans]
MVFNGLLRFRIIRSKQIKEIALSGGHDESQFVKKQTLLTIKQLPPWCDPNPFILSGYRPESRSYYSCLASWLYCHNETGNIYSHLIPGILLLSSQGILYEYIRTKHENLSNFDWSIVSLQLLTASICLLTSTTYHTLLSHSAAVAHRWLQLDYIGIIALILGDFISGLHFGFYCNPRLKYFYWSLILAFSSATAVALLSPRFRGPEWRSFRLGSFICTGLSAFAPIGHACVLWGVSYLWKIGVQYYLLEGLFLIIGCYFWDRRVPESLYPGSFDLWGHSHTIWHVFVTLSIGAHVMGLLHALEYSYRQAQCR